ncbi:MAG: hypothetical protein HN348_11630 [Proteobacteria bacterium]|nr:hypothetical protein [Pseudomonadota bacterium]
MELTSCDIDLRAREVQYRDGSRLTLSPLEAKLLDYLVQRCGQVVKRQTLDSVLNATSPRAVDTAISRLRSKIESDPSLPVHLQTVRGVGYQFNLESQTGLAPPPGELPPSNLTTPLDSFIGRKREMEEFARLLQPPTRLVSLVGPGGVGKTRLAMEFAHTQLALFPNGIWFCPLGEVNSTLRFFRAVSAAINGPSLPETAEECSRALASVMRNRGKFCLILDNIEHLVEHVAHPLTHWLSEAGELTVVVTSRQALNLKGEVRFEVEPLSPTAAIELLESRVRSMRSNFQIADQSLASQVVQTLDRLPLAIELVAGRLKTLSLAQISTQLAANVGWEDMADARRDPQQRSLSATLDWSWKLLSQGAQSALAQSSVFRGGFFSAAAEQVIETGEPIGPIIEELQDKSLLVARESDSVPGEMRLSLLETVRQYAKIKLDDPQTVIDRHSRYYIALGETLSTKIRTFGGLDCASRLALEVDNLNAVYERCLFGNRDLAARAFLCVDALRGVYAWYSDFSPIGTLLERPESLEPDRLHRLLLNRAAHQLMERHDLDLVEADLCEVLSLIPREAPHKALAHRATAVRLSIEVSRLRRDYGQARRHLDELCQLADQLDSKRLAADCARQELYLHGQQGQIDGAAQASEQAWLASRDAGDAIGELFALRLWGRYHAMHDQSPHRLQYLERALLIASEWKMVSHVGMFHLYLALFKQEDMDLDAVEDHLDKAFSIRARCSPMLFRVVEAIRSLIHYAHQGEADAALDALWRYYQLPPTDDVFESAWIKTFEGAIYADRDQLDLAETHISTAEEAIGERASDELTFVTLCRAILHLARARSGEDGEYARAMTIGKATVDARPPFIGCIRRAYGRSLQRTQRILKLDIAVVAADGSWFRYRNQETTVDLSKWSAQRGILAELARQMVTNPAQPVGLARLFATGWPDQQIGVESANHRVHQAISALRKRGLASHLMSGEHGYWLDSTRTQVKEAKPG